MQKLSRKEFRRNGFSWRVEAELKGGRHMAGQLSVEAIVWPEKGASCIEAGFRGAINQDDCGQPFNFMYDFDR